MKRKLLSVLKGLMSLEQKWIALSADALKKEYLITKRELKRKI